MELPPEAARALIGPRADYYLKRWALLDDGRGPALGFNWAAFFGNGFWLLYRRMYRAFWLWVGGLFLMDLVLALAFPAMSTDVDGAITLVIAVTFGKFGSYWYYRFVCRVWRRATAAGATGAEELARRGGTRWWPVIIALVIVGGLLYLLLLGEAVA